MNKNTTPYSPKQNFELYLPDIAEGPLKLYIQNRILGQIEWYDKKSSENQRAFKRCMLVSIILSALIPVFTLLSDLPGKILIKIIITALSSSVTAISAVISLYHFQELWVQYRSNCEILQSMLHRFFTKTGEFHRGSDSDCAELLVMSCEEYMTKEFQTWAASNTPMNDNQPPSTNS